MNYIEITTSTNDLIKKQLDKKNFVSLYTFEQTKGKGRNNRIFVSNSGGLYYSCAFINEKAEPDLSIMPKTALVVSEILDDFFKIKTTIKWVNDVLYLDKKCSGILVEKKQEHIIIGIGINIYNEIPKDLQQKAISILQNEKTNTNLLHLLAKKLDDKMQNIKKVSFDVEKYKQKSNILGKECTLSVPDGKSITNGIVIDFTANGSIVIQNKTGEIKIYECGELSLR